MFGRAFGLMNPLVLVPFLTFLGRITEGGPSPIPIYKKPDLAPEALPAGPDHTAPRQKTAAKTTQRTVCSARNDPRVRQMQLVEDGEDETMPPPRPQGEGLPRWRGAFCGLTRREAACADSTARNLPAHVEGEVGKPRAKEL